MCIVFIKLSYVKDAHLSTLSQPEDLLKVDRKWPLLQLEQIQKHLQLVALKLTWSQLEYSSVCSPLVILGE